MVCVRLVREPKWWGRSSITRKRLKLVTLVVEENEIKRTQEFVLRWSPDGGRLFREIVRQQWNFSPADRIREVEEYKASSRMSLYFKWSVCLATLAEWSRLA
jgi:hypothetical protein